MFWIVVTTLLIFLDIVSGVIKAVYNDSFTSRGLRQGGLRKLSEFICVLMGWGMEYAQLQFGIDNPLPACAAISTYIIIMEIISIFENLGEVSPSLKKVMEPILSALKNKEEK